MSDFRHHRREGKSPEKTEAEDPYAAMLPECRISDSQLPHFAVPSQDSHPTDSSSTSQSLNPNSLTDPPSSPPLKDIFEDTPPSANTPLNPTTTVVFPPIPNPTQPQPQFTSPSSANRNTRPIPAANARPRRSSSSNNNNSGPCNRAGSAAALMSSSATLSDSNNDDQFIVLPRNPPPTVKDDSASSSRVKKDKKKRGRVGVKEGPGSSSSRREVSVSATTGGDGAVIKEVVSVFKSGEIKAILDLLVKEEPEGNAFADVDILELAKSKGLVFPEPSWWKWKHEDAEEERVP